MSEKSFDFLRRRNDELLDRVIAVVKQRPQFLGWRCEMLGGPPPKPPVGVRMRPLNPLPKQLFVLC